MEGRAWPRPVTVVHAICHQRAAQEHCAITMEPGDPETQVHTWETGFLNLLGQAAQRLLRRENQGELNRPQVFNVSLWESLTVGNSVSSYSNSIPRFVSTWFISGFCLPPLEIKTSHPRSHAAVLNFIYRLKVRKYIFHKVVFKLLGFSHYQQFQQKNDTREWTWFNFFIPTSSFWMRGSNISWKGRS